MTKLRRTTAATANFDEAKLELENAPHDHNAQAPPMPDGKTSRGREPKLIVACINVCRTRQAKKIQAQTTYVGSAVPAATIANPTAQKASGASKGWL